MGKSNSPYNALGPGSDGLEVLVALQDGEPRVPDLDRVVLRLLAARRRGRHLLVGRARGKKGHLRSRASCVERENPNLEVEPELHLILFVCFP